MRGDGEGIEFRIPLSRVIIAPKTRLVAFLLEIKEDRIGIMREISELLSGLRLNIHHISAHVEAGRGGVYLVASLPEGFPLEELESRLSSIEGVGGVLHQECDVKGILIDELNFPLMRYGDRVFTFTERAWASLRSNMIAMVGQQAYHAIIFRIGLEMGKGFAETYLEIAERAGIEDPMDVIRHVMAKMLAASGWAKARVDPVEGGLRIILDDCLEAKATGRSEGPSCYFTKGVLAGALSRILRVPIEVAEVRCRAAGDPHCEFSVSLA